MTESAWPGVGADRLLTVARLFEPGPEQTDWEVVFLESARIFRLTGPAAEVNQMAATLADAMAQADRVEVRLAAPESRDLVAVRVGRGLG